MGDYVGGYNNWLLNWFSIMWFEKTALDQDKKTLWLETLGESND